MLSFPGVLVSPNGWPWTRSLPFLLCVCYWHTVTLFVTDALCFRIFRFFFCRSFCVVNWRLFFFFYRYPGDTNDTSSLHTLPTSISTLSLNSKQHQQQDFINCRNNNGTLRSGADCQMSAVNDLYNSQSGECLEPSRNDLTIEKSC
jgi:hypothetical protein